LVSILPSIVDAQNWPFGDAVAGDITTTFAELRTSAINPIGFRLHKGIDIATGNNDVYAVAVGTVVYAGWRGGYGNIVVIRHNNFYSAYAHLDSINSNLTAGYDSNHDGDYEDPGEWAPTQITSDYLATAPSTTRRRIGVEGNTGVGMEIHLHLEFGSVLGSNNLIETFTNPLLSLNLPPAFTDANDPRLINNGNFGIIWAGPDNQFGKLNDNPNDTHDNDNDNVLITGDTIFGLVRLVLESDDAVDNGPSNIYSIRFIATNTTNPIIRFDSIYRF
jgi:murein DD-endopeptidase MepM/ murein hydrolase activator NlpD